ncbi:Ribonuclease Z, mitochondrial [Nosema granulosis]|uniref:ribonuclease Z n=1 Tax=Nosema granulosis TaxID=83296 RepID=A0A9P6H085_9MICR|nr:Ribonuclease Z, mitochondrial [Nosema granulosis]
MQTRFKFISTRSGKALILNIEDKRYVFNMFEGFQRYSIEQSINLKGISTVFLPDSTGTPAFLGYYLTVRDMQKDSLNVVCQKDVFDLIEKAEMICPKKKMALLNTQDFEDEYIKVVTVNSSPRTAQDYIVEFKDVPGKLLVDKIPKELPKKYYSMLKTGADVVFNNKTYRGVDYIEEPVQMGRFLLVFSDLNLQLEKNFSMILCFNEVVYPKINKKYKNVYLMSLNSKVEFESHFRIQKEFNKIDPNYLMPVKDKTFFSYGAIAVSRFLKKPTSRGISKKRFRKNPLPVRNIMLNLKNHLIQKATLQIFNSGDEIVYEKAERSFVIKKGKLQKFWNLTNKLYNNSLLFLGTGCALPSKYRNVSSVLYNIDGNLILFDCGEDTLGQINRVFGSDVLLEKLKFIFISHSHADHCLGIINLLRVINNEIVVFAPSALIQFLKTYKYKNVTFYDTSKAKELENEFYSDYKFKRDDFTKYSFNTLVQKRGDIETIFNEVITNYILDIEVGDFTFYICGVEHNNDSCSVSVMYKDKVKISYSGDTRPSPIFTIMSVRSDALIHESTFNNKNIDKANKTKHSTIQEAHTVFSLSKSKILFLTHFSQRYPKGFVNVHSGIPCMDFYRYVLDISTYQKDKINEHVRSLED